MAANKTNSSELDIDKKYHWSVIEQKLIKSGRKWVSPILERPVEEEVLNLPTHENTVVRKQ